MGRADRRRSSELFARYMEVYAGMVDNIDQNVGRLVDALEELGELDNTIILFTSDNGASREGEDVGTTAYYVHLLQGDDVDADLARLDVIGGPQTTPHYPRGWAMAGNTPFRLYKINTHAGGHSVPFVVLVAGRPATATAASAPPPVRARHRRAADAARAASASTARRERNGRPLKPLAGHELRRDARRPRPRRARHTEQYYEMHGHRGFYRDGWEVVTLHQPLTPFDDDEWELYDLPSDPTELRDLAGAEPGRAAASWPTAWEEAAWANQVYPLDEGTRHQVPRPPALRARCSREPVTIVPGTPTLERWRSLQLIWFRVVHDHASRSTTAAGDQGILVAHGDQGGGYGAVRRSTTSCVFVHNDGRGRMRDVVAAARVPDGAREIVAELRGDRASNVWTVTLSVDGEDRAASSTACRCSSAWRRSRASTSASTAARRCRGTSTSASGRSRTRARCTRVPYAPGEPAPDSPPRP